MALVASSLVWGALGALAGGQEQAQATKAQSTIPAFPGCEGPGCETPGGRAGKVVFVSDLNDSGPGSLREALMMTEPRIVVFKVSGMTYVKSPIHLGAARSYVTVAGQTAPGDGIAIAPVPGAESYLALGGCGKGDFHDGVFRYLRSRSGRRGTANEYRFSARNLLTA